MTFAIQPADKQFAPPGPSPKSYVTESGPPKSVSQANAENIAAAYSPFGDPFVPALHGLLTSQADGSICVIPSAGTQWSPTVTGDDAVQINLAFQYTTEVRLIGATYNIQSTINVPWNYILRGQGPLTVLNYNPAVAGDCIRMFNPTIPNQVFSTMDIMSGILERFTIEGVNAPAGSGGIHLGDGLGYRVHNVKIRNFTGTGGIGFHLENSIWWTEKGIFTGLEIANCTKCIVAEQTGGTNSFEYNHLEAHCYLTSGQVGFEVRGGGQWNGPGGVWLHANVQTNGGPVINVAGTNSKIYDCPLYVRAETGTNLACGPSVNIAATCQIQQCHGYLIFAPAGTGSFQDSGVGIGQLTDFHGRIFDVSSPTQPSQLIQAQGQQAIIMPGVPATGVALVFGLPAPTMVYLNASGVTWTAGGIQLNGTAIVPFASLPATGLVQFAASPGMSVTLNYSAGTITWNGQRITGT